MSAEVAMTSAGTGSADRSGRGEPCPEDRVLPDITGDEAGAGWGELPDRPDDRHGDDERYLRERPPHHEG